MANTVEWCICTNEGCDTTREVPRAVLDIAICLRCGSRMVSKSQLVTETLQQVESMHPTPSPSPLRMEGSIKQRIDYLYGVIARAEDLGYMDTAREAREELNSINEGA